MIPIKKTVFRTELILYLMAASKKQAVKRSISRFFTHLRYIEPLVKGRDLKTMGIPPGPVYRRILQAVLEAKLNGNLKSRQDELDFVQDFIR